MSIFCTCANPVLTIYTACTIITTITICKQYLSLNQISLTNDLAFVLLHHPCNISANRLSNDEELELYVDCKYNRYTRARRPVIWFWHFLAVRVLFVHILVNESRIYVSFLWQVIETSGLCYHNKQHKIKAWKLASCWKIQTTSSFSFFSS